MVFCVTFGAKKKELRREQQKNKLTASERKERRKEK